LYVVDDVTGQAGNIAGGWSLTLTTSDTLAPTPDLGVAMQDTPDPVVVGALLTNVITVANYGPGTATNILVNNTLPASLRVVTNHVPAGVTYTVTQMTNAVVSTNGLGQVETNLEVSTSIAFRLAALASSGTFAVTNVTRTTVEGSVTIASALVTSQVDLNLENNAFSAKTTVAPVPGIEIFRKDDRLVLAWPAAASAFVLEGTPSLVPTQWTTVGGERAVSGDLITVTLDATGLMRYFRLRSP
jgi:uncharacterized repeat protein (TIGR01451 family)